MLAESFQWDVRVWRAKAHAGTDWLLRQGRKRRVRRGLEPCDAFGAQARDLGRHLSGGSGRKYSNDDQPTKTRMHENQSRSETVGGEGLQAEL